MSKKKSPNSLRLRNSTAEFLTFAYQTGGDGVEVRVQEGTIWLSQKGMGQLFETSTDNISLHLKNIFKEGELTAEAVTEEYSATAADGKNYRTKHYNLDAIIAVGYRVNSKRAALFSPQRGILRQPRATPWVSNPTTYQALKGRSNRCRDWHAPSGLRNMYRIIPRALPWAGINRPVGTHIIRSVGTGTIRQVGADLFRANGATHESPGQRPGCRNQPQIKALKGRHNRCPNPSHVSTSTSSSAQRTETRASPTTCGHRSTPTWPRCFKTSDGILDIAMAGTSATLLARKWESALLVNVDNDTLRRIMGNPEAMAAVERIEDWRKLGDNVLETIINKSDRIKELKKKAKEKELSKKEKKELSDEEKEFKSKRKLVQEKLIKFATKIPAFMYLTDFRENTLQDVITKIESGLFETVTGLTVADFHLLVQLKVFNTEQMNQAVFAFRRYEDASLRYTGIESHKGLSHYGLYDTVVARE